MPDETGWQVPAFDASVFYEKRNDACVLIPVINEGSRIRRLLERMNGLEIHRFADVAVVDGGSTDGSLPENLLRTTHVRALLVKTGPGKLGAQLRCGFAWALREGYEHLVTIDGNDKDDPAAIPAFFDELRRGADFVQASRFVPGGAEENTPWLRSFAIRWIHAPLLSWASGFRWTDTTQGFRGHSRRLLLHPGLRPFRDLFVTYELLAYMNYRAPRLGLVCVEVPSARRYPTTGKVPTKISALRGNLSLLKILLDTCRGKHDP